MSTNAVTPEAPAASIEEQINSGFLPTDKEYRKTGKLPTEEKTETKLGPDPEIDDETAETEEASAASESADSAAASAAAEPQEHRPQPKKRDGESRWAQLSRENRDLRERLARLEGREEARQPREPAAPQTAKGRPEPTMDDLAANGKPKYASFDEYLKDLRTWDKENLMREAQETFIKTQAQREAQQREQQINQGLQSKFDKTRAKHADFDEVALNPELVLPIGSAADGFLLDSEHAGEVMYYLGQHPEVLDEFYGDYDPKTGKWTNRISPFAQVRKLMEIEAEVSGSKAAPVRRVTQASRPIATVSTKGTVARDAVEQALEEQDFNSYAREANSRDKRLLSVRAAKGK